ncbi:hypothetical protein [Rhabdothermincola salaria]|uniref:hypothetical protein n=1 Tax=Rhabdothermincola salaria TaxID=2903142 RepID=UPI001E5B398F|nr:hypothetical protein [Rhabdothermincola salaria]MCD9625655.1 hypothetical protein [Rhabdothermincola salaria]
MVETPLLERVRALAPMVDAASDEIEQRAALTDEVAAAVRESGAIHLGTDSLRNPSVIGRCFRDMNAATQHVMVGRKTLTDAAVELLAVG